MGGFPVTVAGSLANGTAVLGGTATLSGLTNIIYESYEGGLVQGPASFGLGGTLAPTHDGVKGLGLNDTALASGVATLSFLGPISSFGGYWGAQTSSPSVTVSFFDPNNSLIESITFDAIVSPNLSTIPPRLIWQGWQSSVPILRVEFRGDYLVVDSLQAVAIPEPTPIVSLVTLLLALMLTRARRVSRS